MPSADSLYIEWCQLSRRQHWSTSFCDCHILSTAEDRISNERLGISVVGEIQRGSGADKTVINQDFIFRRDERFALGNQLRNIARGDVQTSSVRAGRNLVTARDGNFEFFKFYVVRLMVRPTARTRLEREGR